MKNLKVHSLPIKNVISDLAKAMNTELHADCDMYELHIPESLGSGVIRGMDFLGGVGFISYECEFIEDIEIHFTYGKVHPAKFLYILEGDLRHQFQNEHEIHHLFMHQSAIVASSDHHGHILYFEKNRMVKMYSVETDRKVFLTKMQCEIDGIHTPLKDLFLDTKATHSFYHEGSYNLKLFDRLRDIDESRLVGFTRKIFWFSTALGILSEQLLNYSAEIKEDPRVLKLMESDVNLVKMASKLIEDNLANPVNINVLASKLQTYPPKLQAAFKFVYGTTVNKHISRLRIKKAADLLVHSSHSISEIVGMVGLVNRGYFARLFSSHYGCTPQEYRQNCRNQALRK